MKKLILISILFAAITACKKDPPPPEPEQLPPLTHEGLNTFGCKVNGEIWVAKAPFSVGGPVSLHGEYLEADSTFGMTATRKDNDDNIYEDINIRLASIYGTGTYSMMTEYGDGDPRLGFHDLKNNYSCSGYYHDSTNPGTVVISYFDLSNHILSGTFEMVLKTKSFCEDSLMYITEGRFDFKEY